MSNSRKPLTGSAGRTIRTIRVANDVSLRELEQREPALQRSRWSKVERGRLQVKVVDLHRFARALGMRDLARALLPFVDEGER